MTAQPSWRPEPGTAEMITENWLFRLRKERFRSRTSGVSHEFFVLHLLDAVSVVATTTDQQVILVRQFRAGSGLDSLETPGGLVDAGEDPLAAGARELLEETGYAGDEPRWLGTVWSNPSLMTSKFTTIQIVNARKVAEPKFDHGEEVVVELYHLHGIPQLIENGEINHALAILSLYSALFANQERPERPRS